MIYKFLKLKKLLDLKKIRLYEKLSTVEFSTSVFKLRFTSNQVGLSSRFILNIFRF